MTTKLKKKPRPDGLPARGRPTKYDYESWLDGEWHYVEGLENFNGFRFAAYGWADRRGLKVQVHGAGPGRAAVQFYKSVNGATDV